jgi:RimJ/RimL family protein N-acetyltransferase
MTSPTELATPRLWLRQWVAADREPLAQLNADAAVMAHFPNPLTRDESNALADRLESLIATRGWGMWAVELKRSPEGAEPEGAESALAPFIGFVGLHVPSADLPFNPCVEVGWRLAQAYWGQGYATEAAEAALAFGFDTLALNKIVSFTALTNLKSQAVMERLGMTRSPYPFNHPSVPADSPLQPHCLYELSQLDWRQRMARLSEKVSHPDAL